MIKIKYNILFYFALNKSCENFEIEKEMSLSSFDHVFQNNFQFFLEKQLFTPLLLTFV